MRPALFAALVALAACAPPSASQSIPAKSTTAPPTSSPPSQTAPRLDFGRIAQAIHVRTNAERTGQGLSTLAWRDDLGRLAALHSDDMAARQFFDHVNPNGEDPTARGQRIGVTCRIEEGNTVYTGVAENLFYTWPYRGWREESDGRTTTRVYNYRTEAEIAAEVVTGWMNSPGHRANLLGAKSRAEGIALAQAADGRIYVTQVFC